MNHQTLAILDFGSQYTQLIARRVRELQVYCEIFPWDADQQAIEALQPKGYILSGGPTSVYDEGAPTIPGFVLDSGLPILGICYGMQALTQALGGVVASSQAREYGLAQIDVVADNPLSEKQPASVDVARRPHRNPAARLCRPRPQQQQPYRRHGRPGEATLRCTVPPRSAPHPRRKGNPAPLRGGYLRHHA